jgi:lysophospholipase L1-like esterase
VFSFLAVLRATAEAGPVRLILPPVIPAVPGVEANLYFENVVLVVNPANYVFDVDCEKGTQQAERWTFTPKPEDAGSYGLKLRVIDQNNAVIAEADSTVQVVPAGTGKDKALTYLAIGDSLTHASVYTQTLLDHCDAPDTPALTLVGSHQPKNNPLNRHEGYGGWTALRFATHYTGAPRVGVFHPWGSPFVYKTGENPPEIDFGRYCADYNGGAAPNFVTIFLGCNDVFHAVDENLETTIDDILKNMDLLIGMVHAQDSSTRVGLIAPVPPAGTQDAFGSNYNNGQTRWQYLKNQHRLLERMVAAYGGREAEGLSLIPAYINLDCHHNYPASEGPANARDTGSISRLNNGVHPNDAGYQQIGDSIYAWMLARCAE